MVFYFHFSMSNSSLKMEMNLKKYLFLNHVIHNYILADMITVQLFEQRRGCLPRRSQFSFYSGTKITITLAAGHGIEISQLVTYT